MYRYSVFLECLIIRFHASEMLEDALQNEPAPVVLEQQVRDVNSLADGQDDPFPLLNARWDWIALKARPEAEEGIDIVPGHNNAQPEELESEEEANIGKRRRVLLAELLQQNANVERDGRNFRKEVREV